MLTPHHALICNGRLRPANRPVLTADDRGFSVGWAAFETLRCVEGQPVGLHRHLKRLRDALEHLYIVEPSTLTASVSRVAELLAHNGLAQGDARARITVTAGRPNGPPMVLVEASPLPESLLARRKGAHLHTRPFARGPLAHLKTTGWLASILARQGLEGAHEALLVEGGMALECAGGNIAAAVDGALWAPVEGALAGIARAALLEVAQALDWRLITDPLPVMTLRGAQAAWVTSSLLPMAPVLSLDGQPLAQSPSLTAKLAPLLEQRMRCAPTS